MAMPHLTVQVREALAAKRRAYEQRPPPSTTHERKSPPSARPGLAAGTPPPLPTPIPLAPPPEPPKEQTLISARPPSTPAPPNPPEPMEGRPTHCEYAQCIGGPDGGPAVLLQRPDKRARHYCCDDHRVRAAQYKAKASRQSTPPSTPSAPPPPPPPAAPADEVQPMAKKKRRVFDEEFMAKTAARVLDGGEKQSVVSKDIAVSQSVVSSWVAKERRKRDYKARAAKRIANMRSSGSTTKPYKFEASMRDKAVSRVLEGGELQSVVRRDLGLSSSLISKWVNAARANGAAVTNTPKPPPSTKAKPPPSTKAKPPTTRDIASIARELADAEAHIARLKVELIGLLGGR